MDFCFIVAVGALITAYNPCIAAGIVQCVALVVNSLFNRFGNQKAVPVPIAIFIVREIRHGGSGEICWYDAAFTAHTDGLVNLPRVQAVQLGDRDDRRKSANSASPIPFPASVPLKAGLPGLCAGKLHRPL